SHSVQKLTQSSNLNETLSLARLAERKGFEPRIWSFDRPCSVDRTRSPLAVSGKREYFKYSPETIGYFAPEAGKFGVWRPTANPRMSAISDIAEGKISRRSTGWLGREDNRRLQPFRTSMTAPIASG